MRLEKYINLLAENPMISFQKKEKKEILMKLKSKKMKKITRLKFL
jgi:hypothetical protein